ncbi:hypothetical protein BD779DRAFT_1610537 [Infundibulicybe gibba]|nr:hypothetical protein BD779DRAFT_1610537 [Infundibulicybe gibba]
MPVNSLTTEVGLKVGPVVLDTLIKHYFDRRRKDQADKSITELRQNELLYDETFNIVKVSHEACKHQYFSNTRTPSPPWVHVVRVIVPMSCCDESASYLIKALGGEDVARHVVGGVKWWQVRGSTGGSVDAQWITARKDWREAERKQKNQEKQRTAPAEPPIYEQEMDEMRCILYCHGGGYYFGSVDQERYSIQRHARKINGRVFAVNYRLAPQFPFPCALQDMLLLVYLYLIRPPPGASHCPVNPGHIVIAGDSAGGGITLALLQIIRDSGLPAPAGGVLISPWCDLTHSFPSDVIPPWGLSLQKPSLLWPPPSDEITSNVRATLRSRIRQAFHMEDHHRERPSTPSSIPPTPTLAPTGMPVDVGTTTPVPPLHSSENQKIVLTTQSGEVLTIDQQVHLYTQNSLIAHPLISSALSYLGGLPPLLVIASDKEVLRDEIIYAAHKAAEPEKYPIRDSVRAMYPALIGIEDRCKPTKVHLQVYDDTAHVLPVLFSFTTPAKYCFRSIATFTKHVTGMNSSPHTITAATFSSTLNLSPFPTQDTGLRHKTSAITIATNTRPTTAGAVPTSKSMDENQPTPPKRLSLRRSISHRLSRASSFIQGRSASYGERMTNKSTNESLPTPKGGASREDSGSSDVGGPRFRARSTSRKRPSPSEYTAGDPIEFPWSENIIRERVSTQGIIRALEPEPELDAFKTPQDIIGVLSELSIRRYLDARARFDQKFASTIKSVDKQRHRNLDRAKHEPIRSFTLLHEPSGHESGTSPDGGRPRGSVASPPPSSIVSRRDTEEARKLAMFADRAVLEGNHSMSGNNLWSMVVGFFTPPSSVTGSRRSRLSRFFGMERHAAEATVHPTL